MSEHPEPGFVVISLSGITAMGHHGVLDSERDLGQPFVVDVELLAAEPANDQLGNAVNYAELAQLVTELIGSEPSDLIETLAVRIADAVVEMPGVRDVEVTVHKPRAPIPVPFGDVKVTVKRTMP
jgi:dihydroneopterin aldolase